MVMAEKRYSKEDQQKILKETMNNLNARGADFQDCWPLHPDGVLGVVNELKKDPAYVVAQSQAQTEKNRETTRHLNDPKD
jgi:hypothetical protein